MESSDAVNLTDQLHAEQGKGDPFAAAVRATRMPMIITDPRQDDNPIVFTNDAFLRLTGYERDEVMGRNCRFLQGPETDRSEIDRLRQAIREQTDVDVEILNYRKDGSSFWNALYLSPVFGQSGELQFFFASQFDVTDRKLREIEALQSSDFFESAVKDRTTALEAALNQQTLLLHEVDHRVKNNLQMVAAMIRSQSRFSESPEVKEALKATMTRVETLGTVHRKIYQSSDVRVFDVAGFAGEVAQDIVEAVGRTEIEVVLDLSPLMVPSVLASPLSLLLNELITNALKHAFPVDGHPGKIKIATSGTEGVGTLIVEDDGIGVSEDGAQSTKTFGHRLVDSLVRQIHGTIDFAQSQPGTRVTVTFQNEPGAEPLDRI